MSGPGRAGKAEQTVRMERTNKNLKRKETEKEEGGIKTEIESERI